MKVFPVALCFLIAGLTAACSGAQERDLGVDEMVFADDSAIVSIPAWKPPPRPRRVASAGTPVLPRSGPLPGAVCDGNHDSPSRSIGQATDGALQDACRMPANGSGWVSVNRPSSFGTDEAVAMLQWAAAQVVAQYPGSHPVVFGALSAENGGTLRPHKSHQSGRDVDISYFHTDKRALRRFEPTDSGNLDSERTWAFLETLLYTGNVAFVFMDYNIQAVLYADLLDSGWSEDGLAGLFQYPAGPGVPRGVIRHATGHADHFHVRFRCADKDKPDCAD